MKLYTGDEIYKEILECLDVEEKYELSDIQFISRDDVVNILSTFCQFLKKD